MNRLSKKYKFQITFEDYPRPYDWKLVKGLFSEDDSNLISSVSTSKVISNKKKKLDNLQPDLILRFGYPIDLRPALTNHSKVLTLATAEYGVDDIILANGSPEWSKLDNIILMVPSKWSINLFHELASVPSKNIFYLPHGYNPKYFFRSKNKKDKKNENECLTVRKTLDIPSNSFIYLNTG